MACQLRTPDGLVLLRYEQHRDNGSDDAGRPMQQNRDWSIAGTYYKLAIHLLPTIGE